MTYIRALLGQVFASLFRNKLRSFLTMGGIAWGIASIVLIVAMGDGFRDGQKNNMKSLGENIVILFGGRTSKQAGFAAALERDQDIDRLDTRLEYLRTGRSMH